MSHVIAAALVPRVGLKYRTSDMVKLGMSGCRDMLSTCVVTQQLSSIAKPFRKNADNLLVSTSWMRGI